MQKENKEDYHSNQIVALIFYMASEKKLKITEMFVTATGTSSAFHLDYLGKHLPCCLSATGL